MDFGKLDARTAANDAKPLHMRHPVTGALLYSDGSKKKKACIVMVRGAESRIVQARLSEIRAQRAIDEGEKKAADPNVQGMQDVHEKLARDMHPLVTGFENIFNGTTPLDASKPDDVTWFLNLQLINNKLDKDGKDLSFLGQMAEFAGERGNWLGNSKGD